jgi:hypothetical protein
VLVSLVNQKVKGAPAVGERYVSMAGTARRLPILAICGVVVHAAAVVHVVTAPLKSQKKSYEASVSK